MSGTERSGMAGFVRMIRLHALPMAAAFLAAATAAGVLAEIRWRDQTVVRSAAAVPAAHAARRGSNAADLLLALGQVFDSELDRTRAQIAERDQGLTALEAEAASGSSDPAARAARLSGARRRVSALASALAVDRARLSSLETAAAPAPRPADPEVVAANQAAGDAEARLVELERRLTPQHPDVVKQRDVLHERQSAVATAVARSPLPAGVDDEERSREMRLVTERIAAQEIEQRQAAASVAALEAGSSVATATAEERARLQRERDSLQAVYEALDGKRADLAQRASAMAAAAAATEQRELMEDRQSVSPVGPREADPVARRLTAPWLAIGGAGSLLVALLVGLLLDARDTRIHDVSDLRVVTPATLLVSVSEIVPLTKTPKTTDREISTLPEPTTPTLIWHPRTPRRAIEQYRRLAQALRRIRVDRQTRVIGVTSALPAEGKTLSAVNLAVSLAESYRQRVLIIDADLRRPAVSRLLALPPQQGLADWLRRDDQSECPMVRLTSRLSVIPAGAPSNDPTPLLTSMRMALVIAAARADFDWVVVDTPPTGLIADAGAIEGSLDGFIVIAAAGRTSAAALRQTIESLGADRVLGVVLNRVKRSTGAESDAYSDYYSTSTAPQ